MASLRLALATLAVAALCAVSPGPARAQVWSPTGGYAPYAYSTRPVIADVRIQDNNGYITGGDTVSVFMRGTPGGAARFDVSGGASGVAMSEVQPGFYQGTFGVPSTSGTRRVKVTAHLAANGAEARRSTTATIGYSPYRPGNGYNGYNPYGYNTGNYPYGYNNGSYNNGTYPYGYNNGSYNNGAYPYGYNNGSYNNGTYPYGYNNGSYNNGTYPYGYNNGNGQPRARHHHDRDGQYGNSGGYAPYR
jgi:hypothetical protein